MSIDRTSFAFWRGAENSGQTRALTEEVIRDGAEQLFTLNEAQLQVIREAQASNGVYRSMIPDSYTRTLVGSTLGITWAEPVFSEGAYLRTVQQESSSWYDAHDRRLSADLVLAIRRLWPDDDRIVIAGSAAIAPETADDVDVFFLADVVPSFPLEIPGLLKLEGSLFDEYPSGQAVVGESIYRGHKIQLIQSTALSVEGLLASFDLSCHAHALMYDGTRISHPRATLPGAPIVVLNGDQPKTFTRLGTFTQRYYRKEA